MYKVVIIDDEKMTRTTISGYINECTDDFEVVGCFADGEAAFSYIKDNKVDIVITDIKMPKMSGIDLIEKINEIHSECHIIIISGFGKFEYAKKAVEYHAENYILKPIDIDELLETMNNIKNKLDLKKSNDVQSTEEFFMDLLKGGMTEKNAIMKKYEKAGFSVPFEKSFGCVFVLEILNFNEYIIENWKYGKEGIYTAFLNIFKMNFGIENVYAIENSNVNFFFVLLCEHSKVSFTSQELEESFREILKINVKIVKKEFFKNISELPSVVGSLVGMQEIVSLLLMHLINGEKTESLAIFNRYCKNGDEFYNHIMENLYSRLEKLGILFSRIKNFVDCEECVDYLIYNIKANDLKDDFIITRAKEYIEKNYQNEISREDVANTVFLNSAYFSKYFKKKTGETFYNYLLKIRMTKAMSFLKTGKSTTEVCKLIGYANIRYFNKKFKQFTGYTPSEYKKKMTDSKKEL